MTIASRHYRPEPKPIVRRVLWPGTSVWVWGLFRTKDSRLPYMMATEVARLTEMLGRREERRIARLLEQIARMPVQNAGKRILDKLLPKNPAPK